MSMDVVQTNNYERLPEESDEDWEAFKIYRDTGVDRSLDIFSAYPRPVYQRIKQAYIKYAWGQRARKFDRDNFHDPELDRLLSKDLTPQKRLELITHNLSEAALVEAFKLAVAVKSNVGSVMDTKELILVVDAIARLERIISDKPDQTIGLRLDKEDRGQLQDLIRDRQKVALVDEILRATEDRKNE